MKDWISEVLEQTAVAALLGRSRSPVHRRLSLIICDDAFEFAMKAFVEFESSIIGKSITYADWRRDYKGSFEKVVSLVLSHKSEAFDRGIVMRYHSTRSDLYHEPKPLTVDEKTCENYVDVVHKALGMMAGLSISGETIAEYQTKALKAIAPRTEAIVTSQHVEAKLGGGETDSEAICAVVYLFHQKHGRPPGRRELIESLSRSGHAVDDHVLSTRISDLRRTGAIARGEFALRPRGRRTAQSVLTEPK